MFNLAIYLICFLQFFNCFSANVIVGNSSQTNESFNFLIHKGALSGAYFFVAANEAVAGNEWALSAAGVGASEFFKLAPSKVSLNNKSAQDNPLTGKKIGVASYFESVPILVPDGEKKVCVVNNVLAAPYIDILQTKTLNDSNSAEIESILALAGREKYIAALVKGNGATTFGDAGSGVALIEVTGSEVEKKIDGEKRKITQQNLDVLNAVTGESEGNKALPLTGATDAVKSGGDATITADIVDIHWCGKLLRYYITLSVKSGSSATDKVKAVVIGRFGHENDKIVLKLDSIVAASAISGTNQIVAADGANEEVQISKVRTIETSTRLDYLIVAGGNGTTSGNKVFALPLVNKAKVTNVNLSTNTDQGTLADVTSTPTDYYQDGSFYYRAFTEVATSSADLFIDSSAGALVGGGPLPLDSTKKISDLFVQKDAVFAVVDQESSTEDAGIWQSQAIFDEKGRIANWTAWEKVVGTTTKVFSGGLNSTTGIYYYVTENNSSEVKTVKKTSWSAGYRDGLLGGTTGDSSVGLVELAYDQLSQKKGGIQGLKIFRASSTTGLGNNFNLAIATGDKKIFFAQTRDASGSVVGDYSTHSTSSIDDTMPATISTTRFVSLSGSALASLGPITCSEIITNGTDHWIVVGGVNGIAVLADSAGAGWSGAIDDFTGLSTDLAFKNIGNFSFVRKIISDSDYLYILTEEKLYRMQITSGGISANNISTTVVAQVESKNTPGVAFYDALISGDFCLLGTTFGLYRIANGGSVQTGGTSQEWSRVTVPDGLDPVIKLIPVTSTLEESDFVNQGQVYVLSSFIGFHESRLNRFYVNLSGAVDDDTIQQVPDKFFNTGNSFFVNFRDFRNNFFTNGTVLASLRSADVAGEMSIRILPLRTRSGSKFPDSDSTELRLNLEGFYQLIEIQRVPFLGSLIYFGDFGLRVNE